MNREETLAVLRAATNETPLFFILGPCAIESEDLTLSIAEYLKNLSEKLRFPFIFKAAFDKANRSSLSGFRGLGMDEGLRILQKVRDTYDVPIVTDVHEAVQVAAVAQVADVIQIPAFLARQTDLLIAAGQSGKIVHVKKGQFMTAQQAGKSVEKIKLTTGNQSVWLCERGYTFGYENLIVDYRNFTTMREFAPIVFDATHSVQLPGAMNGCSSGGERRFVSALAVAAVSQRIAGLFMEVHPDPDRALCDGPNSIPLARTEELIVYLQELDAFVKSRLLPVTE